MDHRITPETSLALFTSWFPSKIERVAIAKVVVRSIKRTHRRASFSWEFTHRNGYARLNVGQIAVLDVSSDGIILYGMRRAIPKLKGITLVGGNWNYAAVPGEHRRWLVAPNAVSSIPRELFGAHDQLVDIAWKAKRRSPFRSSHTPGAVIALSELLGNRIDQPAYYEPVQPEFDDDSVRELLGDGDSNRAIEHAAIRKVTEDFESNGWTVRSRESECCGYDLECRRGRSTKHVEVKGRSGNDPSCVLTANELHTAETDPEFELVIVTNAGTENAAIHTYDWDRFQAGFQILPMCYSARPLRSPSTK